ncbi:MAG TPA: chemotaxis protein CheW [Gemmatimonadaceae bacterium]|nr:chemotaxis protein CheW [Gemmatimonadaceae bacterium]
MHLLTFTLDGDRYALDAATVRLVERAVAITPLPRAPALVEGVIDVHGTLAPVFDLRRRFGLAARELTADEHLIVASAGDRLVAFRVDEALDLVAAPDDLAHVPPLAGGAAGEGVARLSDGAVAIYDLTTFLDASERATLDAALVSAREPGVATSG